VGHSPPNNAPNRVKAKEVKEKQLRSWADFGSGKIEVNTPWEKEGGKNDVTVPLKVNCKTEKKDRPIRIEGLKEGKFERGGKTKYESKRVQEDATQVKAISTRKGSEQ